MFFPVLCKKTERTGQEKAEKYGTGAMQEEEPHRRIQKHDIPARRNTGKERPAPAQKFFPGRRKATFSTFPISKISHIHGTPLLQARPMSFVRRGLDIGVNQPGSIIPQFFRAGLAEMVFFCSSVDAAAIYKADFILSAILTFHNAFLHKQVHHE